jgi:site-specific DNA recombinase
MKHSPGKPRFACLVRVSTERQERKGESLATQLSGNTRDVEVMGGTIAGVYGGQEHATPGWERAEVDRLLQDAARGKFNAVIVAYADRWSRDNRKSKEGLEVFRQHGIKFFIGTMEMDLFDPQANFILGMNAEVGEFIAAQQSKKSMENRIARARRGWPVAGHLPWGRTWCREKREWGIDAEKQRIAVEVARRYIDGESMVDLAAEFGVAHSFLHRTLMDRSGDKWLQTFTSKRLNIKEEVWTTVPALLDLKTIQALHERKEARKTYAHGPIKYRYLLSRMVFCAECGQALTGHALTGRANKNNPKRRYYRHIRYKWSKGRCPEEWSTVYADTLEDAVMSDLFELFGNPAAVMQAVAAAAPGGDEREQLLARQGEVMGLLAEVKAKKNKIVKAIANGVLDDAEAAEEMRSLRKREDALRRDLCDLKARLANQPDPEEARRLALEIEQRRKAVNADLGKMTWDEKRTLVELVFAGRSNGHGVLAATGERHGVYVRRGEDRRRGLAQQWYFRLSGRIAVR